MVGSNVDQRVFAELVDVTFPDLSAHLEKIGMPIIICSLPWFLCFFISYVPMEVALRILDWYDDLSFCLLSICLLIFIAN